MLLPGVIFIRKFRDEFSGLPMSIGYAHPLTVAAETAENALLMAVDNTVAETTPQEIEASAMEMMPVSATDFERSVAGSLAKLAAIVQIASVTQCQIPSPR
ncbi:hypothetical protein SAMN06297251_102135 [Fulvimarina manganoxydans]|uniref:Uncharacterized protein n=1 Tax=Fulvimarina manganoxydans TaxID=937218 RepID=A0A1W1Z3P2_9HYPH|nr:hypothetical protein [Fulvimarina manganoxydans]SMC43080.1 hypothetical protein SAMN06297251_102135 [Fulvimarina manganoxydans]